MTAMKQIITPVKTLILLSFLLLFASSCQKMYDEEEEPEQKDYPLKVSARATGETQISYPAYIYAFAEDGSCTAMQKMMDGDSPIELKLPPAKYTLVALAGLGEEYEVPEEPQLTDVITMKKDNQSGRALMTGRSVITVADGKDATVSITLRYAVSLVNVTLENIPSNIETVKLKLSPLHSSMSFDGEYTGAGKSAEVTCQKESGGTWSAEPFYVFPGSGTQTVFDITMENGTQTKTYSHTFEGKPEANVPFNIGGSYQGEITLDGSLIPGDWEEEVKVEFGFGNPDDGKDDGKDPPVTEPDGLPEIGSIWNKGIVGGFTNVDSDGADVLLMGLEEWFSLTGKAQAIIDEASVDGWHLPDEAEAKMLHAGFAGNVDELNETIENSGYGTPIIDIEKRFLYDKDGEFFAFGFKPKSSFQRAGTSTKYKIRMVKSVRCNVN